MNSELSTSSQKKFPRTLRIEVWSSVWLVNLSKSTFLHQRDLELCDSHVHPNFHLFIIKVRKTLLFPILRKIYFLGKVLEAHCSLNVQFSTQIRASLFYNKTLALWVCTFLEDEKSIPEKPYQKNNPTPCWNVYMPAQYLVQCSTNCFKVHRIKKWNAETVLRKSKGVVQTRDESKKEFDPRPIM